MIIQLNSTVSSISKSKTNQRTNAYQIIELYRARLVAIAKAEQKRKEKDDEKVEEEEESVSDCADKYSMAFDLER